MNWQTFAAKSGYSIPKTAEKRWINIRKKLNSTWEDQGKMTTTIVTSQIKGNPSTPPPDQYGLMSPSATPSPSKIKIEDYRIQKPQPRKSDRARKLSAQGKAALEQMALEIGDEEEEVEEESEESSSALSDPNDVSLEDAEHVEDVEDGEDTES